MAAPVSIERAVRSPGQPIQPAVREFMEDRFGCDFSGVRLHADAAAARSAGEVNARAYTVGNHIVFGAGELQPESLEGGRLLAHELAHVVQQSAGAPAVQRQPRTPDPGGEREAAVAEAETVANITAKQLEAQSDAEDALKLDWRRRKEKGYAWQLGRKDRDRLLRVSPNLSRKFQEEISVKLNFFQREAKAAYLRTITPALAGFPEQAVEILNAPPGVGAPVRETTAELSCDAGLRQFPLYDEAYPERSRCMDISKDPEYTHHYFDNNIQGAVGYSVEETTWENVDYGRFHVMLVNYRNGSSEYFVLSEIGDFISSGQTPIVQDHGYLKRANGLTYPIHKGQLYLIAALAPRLVAYKNGLKYQVKQLQDLYQLLQVAGAHASILGAYGLGSRVWKAAINAFRRTGPATLPGTPLPGRPQPGQITGAKPPGSAVAAFSDHFSSLLSKPFNQAGTRIKVGGVDFGGVNALVRGRQLVVTYSHIINTGRGPGDGRLMHAALEQGGVQLAKRLGLSSVKVGVFSVQSPHWQSHLQAQGYSHQTFALSPTSFLSWTARDFPVP